MLVRSLWSILILAVLAVGGAGQAFADDDDDDDGRGGGHRGSSVTFAGTCQFSGKVRQDPPLTNTPQTSRAQATAGGTCSGTLTDSRGQSRTLTNERVQYSARATGELMSCAGSPVPATGEGQFRFRRGERLDFDFTEVRGPGEGNIVLTGEDGGSAAGEATVSQDEDPLEIIEKCSGKGLREVKIDINLVSPGISG
jgi:hypothetical protein